MDADTKMSEARNTEDETYLEDLLDDNDSFARRHIGPSPTDRRQMLSSLGFDTLDDLIDQAVPPAIRSGRQLDLGVGLSEANVLAELRKLARENKIFRSYIGMGYHDCITPAVIQRNILENPGWYTQYTPYQPEISQGRLEALLNFQTMVADLTALEIANASLLDEGTAAAEAMRLSYVQSESEANAFFVSETCHPQTIAVVRTRAEALGLEVVVGDHSTFDFERPVFGVLLQCPASDGAIFDYARFVERAHEKTALVTVATDLLSLTMLKPPGEFGADIAVGNSQRFGVPMGYGGPHAAFFATREQYKRQMPGRLVGVSKDAYGRSGLRLALQTREQHIRREKATSNICTAQVLLAVIAGMYAVHHGPEGLRRIAQRIQRLTAVLAEGLKSLGYTVGPNPFFDTLRVAVSPGLAEEILESARSREINLRRLDDATIGMSLNETTSLDDVRDLCTLFARSDSLPFDFGEFVRTARAVLPDALSRKSGFLSHPVFSRYHSETEMLRYIRRLESRDLSLTTSMIPLGSCTMKLNAAAEMLPITWPEFARLHPFVPQDQALGYRHLLDTLERWLNEITGFDAISFQPNAGSQGEYSGLLVIRKFHRTHGESQRNRCLIPQSAHGTNPASAVMAGLEVVVVGCDVHGNVDLVDLRTKAEQNATRLAALMVTYPSTHGVFEEAIRDICDVIHRFGGQVYMDGANLNAQVGLCRPGEIGVDVCHLNLHKTFCIPHGGGGPGMGPIGVKSHLVPYLPNHPVIEVGGRDGIGAVASAPWGSPGILPISWAYIALMGSKGLTEATKVAILNANYIAGRLNPYFPLVYKGARGLVAHECILDLRPFRKSSGIEVEDIAKRLMDYGFHSPTVSFPVVGTIMVEPTESESREELDRFCDAMISIRKEIMAIESGKMDARDNVLKNAPHTAEALASESWKHPYDRETACFPAPWTREHKFWPAVGRIDNASGDRHLVCVCPPLENYGKP